MSECMFCSPDPCTCSTSAKASPAKARPASRKKSRGPAPLKQGRLNTKLSTEELDYRACVRALEPILSVESKREVSHILNALPTLEERNYAWNKAYNLERSSK